MAGKVKVLKDRCKGCGLCVIHCPKGVLAIGEKFNAQGYAHVEFGKQEDCAGCAFCAELCPDAALVVYRKESA